MHREVPLAALLGICCNNVTVKQHLDDLLAERGLQIDIKATPNWYF